ncbi:MAG: 2-oxoglutarate dehydrogenase, E2 component, dihydrolipoamide succinyltransferase, partial [Chloroflexi bacterium]|nr:2-oxoglutarate dehydrogenase, E2 component, dihydrolipoamide succinyltransferase [Chloroflexota bacterium]
MPQLGESVAEGTIGKWLKQPGDQVAKYEPLVEVVTDKVNAEVPSPFAGVLREILVQEGETVPNNAEIAVIETGDDAAASAGTSDAPAGSTAGSNGTSGSGVPAAAPPDSGASENEPSPSEADTNGPAVEVAVGPAGSDERGPSQLTDAAAPAAG